MFSSKAAVLFRNAFVRHVFGSGPRTSQTCDARVAVVLSGCGAFDGSEIHEASAVLVHLSRAGAETEIFAPDMHQADVVNHASGTPSDSEIRNVYVESARIARGKLFGLNMLKAKDFDAVIFPGGFGVAKNLCTFERDSAYMTVMPDVERVLREFRASKKPMGLCCIAPILAAKVFHGCTITVGSDKDENGRWPYYATVESINFMHANHVKKDVLEICVDTTNKLVTTPAFMCDTDFHHIFDGIGLLVAEVLKLTKKKKE